MNGAIKPTRLIHFSTFELDVLSGELFKQGRKIKLQGQPFELLVALLERPGEVLTREELRQKIWPSETAGGFDNGLNRAVNKIREALGDSAENPRFIETLPRRGYRFIGSIQDRPVAAPAADETGQPVLPSAPPVTPAPETGIRTRRIVGIAVTVAAAFLVAAVLGWFAWRKVPGKSEVRMRQLTTNSSEDPVENAVISPDGNYVAYGDHAGIEVRLISTGESHLLPRPPALSAHDLWVPTAWFPDQTHLLASSTQFSSEGRLLSAWTVSVIGGTAVKIRDHAWARSVSPDGSAIAFTTSSASRWESLYFYLQFMPRPEIWVMDSRGNDARRIVFGQDSTYIGAVRWSPNGKRLAYQTLRSGGGISWDYALETCDLNGRSRSVILSKRQQAGFTPGTVFDLIFPDFVWLPDNRVVYPLPEDIPNTSRDSNLWQINVDEQSGTARGQPLRITNLTGFDIEGLSAGASANKIVFQSITPQSTVYVGRLGPGGALVDPRRLTLDERYNTPWAWTANSKAVIFTSDRTGKFLLYKQAVDQDYADMIPTGSDDIRMARLSPDGASVLYAAVSTSTNRNPPGSVQLKRIRLDGGPAQAIFRANGALNFSCPSRPETECVAAEHGPHQMFFSFDPLTGARHELFRADGDFNWTVSPDGSRIAATAQGQIEIRSLSGELEKKFEVKGWPHPEYVDWAADGRSLFVSHPASIAPVSAQEGIVLLHVDLEGHAKPLWRSDGGEFTWGLASPDGKYLAIYGMVTGRNAWMLAHC
jgi:DNA-binding winged helix-turn-helix (wHTH) protein/Tol biopolymer transport system component